MLAHTLHTLRHTLRHTRFAHALRTRASLATNANYANPNVDEFVGEFADIRATLDYAYHVNYTPARQLWQDRAIKSVVVRTAPQIDPWVVYTCGPMGAGKGYTLSWMSRHGVFPLEDIVHVDPDYFKQIMPEWNGYVKHVGDASGSKCHKESGYIQEIAQEVAMRQSQNVWVDGSLHNGAWFSTVFATHRRVFPQYRLAIFVISAPESIVRERIKKRAAETGRGIPEASIVQSLQSVATSLEMLTPLVDFVARITNVVEPELRAFERIDTKGNWGLIESEFAKTHAAPNHFPHRLAPLIVQVRPVCVPLV